MTASISTSLICYDISESPSRLAKVRRSLLEVAAPVQQSVFLGRFTQAQRREIVTCLAKLIDPRKDDIRIYPVPQRPAIQMIGRQLLPEGVFMPTSVRFRSDYPD
jgi:CRISPR-associated protein Cas2